MIADFRSDTVTQPTLAMKAAMLEAPLGDDVFGEDPTVNALEATIANICGHEAALFCASGTMANQIAVKAHTQPMDEIILDKTAHIYYYETAGFAFHSGVSVKLAEGHRGIITPELVLANIQPDFDWLPKTSLVCLENTSNKGGGECYTLENIIAISQLCREKNLSLHMDGARLFNASVAMGYSLKDIGAYTDSLAICFSKGLGAPVGSVLTGTKNFIKKARRIRKVFGGGMRQSGMLAAACLYALENHVHRLKEDHEHAALIANCLENLTWVTRVLPAKTNIVIFSIDITQKSVQQILDALKKEDILAVAFGPSEIRLVTHLDITPEMVQHCIAVLQKL